MLTNTKGREMTTGKKAFSLLKTYLETLVYLFLVHPLDEMEIAKMRYKHMEIYF